QAAQDRLDRRETTLDRGGGGTPPRRASGHIPRPNRNSRVRLAGKLRARILHRRTDGGIRPAHGAVARRLRAQAIGRRKVAENSALSSSAILVDLLRRSWMLTPCSCARSESVPIAICIWSRLFARTARRSSASSTVSDARKMSRHAAVLIAWRARPPGCRNAR